MCDDILNDVGSSEGSLTASTGLTSPESGPLFCASDITDLKLGAAVQTQTRQLGQLVDTVQNVCVVGAGYVGKCCDEKQLDPRF